MIMSPLLERILRSENLTARFQPIVRLLASGRSAIVGFEGLTRGPVNTNMEYPSVLFEYARRKNCDVRIALDDVGVGDSNIQMLVDCRPDLLKIDRYFVDGCSKDRFRQAVIGSLVHLARGCGSEVLCEGVENEEDLATIFDLGVDLIQGFIFCKPLSIDELEVFETPVRWKEKTSTASFVAGMEGSYDQETNSAR